MYWADKIAEEIIRSGKYKPYWVDDMKTPSGRVHIGAVRTFMTHELIYRALRERGVDVNFSYVFEDHDPFDKIPHYLNQEEYRKYLGKPLCDVPSPDPGYENYGQRWAMEYKEVLSRLGINPQIIWGSELYKSGKMNELVRLCLDSADEIRKIYGELYGEDKPDSWFPFQPKCPKCGKISTTNVTAWDGSEVAFVCEVNNVDWTEGCGFSGKVSPFDGNGKMPWKVEWPCKWKAIGVTIEGAGKDHMSAGGSHDFAKLMCERIIDYSVPYAFAHEFFLIGGKKMSSSKGTGASAKDIADLLPPELMRFIVARVKYTSAINFNPEGDTIPKLYDDYDVCADAYWNRGDQNKACIFKYSQITSEIPDAHFLPRFSDVVNYVQDAKTNLYDKFSEIKGSPLTDFEREVLDTRAHYAKIWLKDYAPEEEVFIPTDNIPEQAGTLTEEQKKYLREVVNMLSKDWDAEALQAALYDKTKELGIPPKDAFAAIYLSLIGKTHGPKAAWFLLDHLEVAKNNLSAILNK